MIGFHEDRWQVSDSGDGFLDISPIYDLHQHVADASCWCKPKLDVKVRIHNIGEERLPGSEPTPGRA